jgi:hypothetical protein
MSDRQHNRVRYACQCVVGLLLGIETDPKKIANAEARSNTVEDWSEVKDNDDWH